MEVRHLTYTYEEGKAKALQDISVNFNKGSFSALVGKSGSGKVRLSEYY